MNQQLPLTPKVGEVPEGCPKFNSWSGVHGYYKRPDTALNPFVTDKMMSGHFDKEFMLHNQSLCSTMRETNKSTVEFKVNLKVKPKMLSTSNSKESFIDQRYIANQICEISSSDNFERSFDKFATWDSDDNKFLKITDIPDLIRDCMGIAPDFVVDKFKELAKRESVAGRISWPIFR